MGSGTTLACAIARRYKVSGTDINCIAELITRVKCTSIEPKYLKNKINNLLADLTFLEAPLFPTKLKAYIPSINIERIDYWFKPEIKEELGVILSRINGEKEVEIKIFLRFVLAISLKQYPYGLWEAPNLPEIYTKRFRNLLLLLKDIFGKWKEAIKDFGM